jgi:1-acyl-sn-glycerol-3-phosphate acyltransferase
MPHRKEPFYANFLRTTIRGIVPSTYNIAISGLEHIPDKGPAILIGNHVSFIDGLIITAAIKRPVRFLVDKAYAKFRIVKFVYNAGKFVQIGTYKDDPNGIHRAFEEVGLFLQRGDLICIFPEGWITKTGEVEPFKRGIDSILSVNRVPVIPFALQGLWGSVFSKKNGGQAFNHIPLKLRAKVGLKFGPPILPPLEGEEGVWPPDREFLRQKVIELRGDWP